MLYLFLYAFLRIFLCSHHVTATVTSFDQASTAVYQNSSKVIHPPQDATNAASCVTCAIYLDVGLEKHFWLNTALPATLATLQFDVTQYNNTAITNTRTIFDDYTTLWERSSGCDDKCKSYPIIQDLDADFGPGPYGAMSFLNENETTAVGSNGFIMTSPTAYDEVAFFGYFTIDENNDGHGDCLTESGVGSLIAAHRGINSVISLSTNYRQPIGGALDEDILKTTHLGDLGYEPFPSQFYDYLMSNSALLSSLPFLKTCYTAYAHGAPSIKLRVSVLTTSNYNTITRPGIYIPTKTRTTPPSSITPVPGSVVRGITVASTPSPKQAATSEYFTRIPHETPASQPSPNPPAAAILSTQPSILTKLPEIIVKSQPPSPAAKSLPNQSSAPEKPPEETFNQHPSLPDAPAVSEPNVAISIIGNQDELSFILKPPSGEKTPLPPIKIGASTYTADSKSEYHIGSKTLAPGAPPITIDNVQDGLPTVLKPPSGEKTPLPPIEIGASTYTADSKSEYYIGSKALAPGAPPITIDNVPYSLDLSLMQLNAGSNTISLIPLQTAQQIPAPPIITIGEQQITADSASNYRIGTQTLIPGGPAITVNNVPYSLAPSAVALVSAGSTVVLASPKNGILEIKPPILTIGSKTYVANSASQYLIGAQTLIPGGPAITIQGTPYSLDPSAKALIAGASTVSLSPPYNIVPLPAASGLTVEPLVSNYVIGAHTIVPGGPAVTINGVPYSLVPSATALVSGTQTIPLTYKDSRLLPTITIAGNTFTANSASQYIVGSQTLIPGGSPITIGGIPYSLAPSATALVSNHVTVSLTPGLSRPTALTVDGQILAPGSAITVDGTKISLGSQGTDVVVGSSTEAIGLGGLIISGIGGVPTPATGNATDGVLEFPGGVERVKSRGWILWGLVMVGVGVWIFDFGF